MKYIIKLLRLIICIILWQIPTLIGATIVQNNLAWYHTLPMPLFSPPDAMFCIMWAVLYLLLGIATFLSLEYSESNTTQLKVLWIIQLVLNASWTPLFFGLHAIGLALLILVFLLAEGILLWYVLKKQTPKTAWLLAPYLLWLCFASYLNVSFYWVA